MSRKHPIFAFLILLLALCVSLPARADLTITPKRVVFEGRDRTAMIELINMTDHANTYRLKWLTMKMGETGRYEMTKADDKDPYSFDKMVLFTPRQVTIGPHGHQTIRLSLRRPADLPYGEYRAHLAMIRLAQQGPERPDPSKKGVSMDLQVNLGFSVPVIVRSGEDKDLKISLVDPKLVARENKGRAPTPELSIGVHRDAGTFSSYGVLRVFWQPKGGSEREIGATSNVALYPELQTRVVPVPLHDNPTNGILRIVYEGKYESEGKTWAEKTFPIGK